MTGKQKVLHQCLHEKRGGYAIIRGLDICVWLDKAESFGVKNYNWSTEVTGFKRGK